MKWAVEAVQKHVAAMNHEDLAKLANILAKVRYGDQPLEVLVQMNAFTLEAFEAQRWEAITMLRRRQLELSEQEHQKWVAAAAGRQGQ